MGKRKRDGPGVKAVSNGPVPTTSASTGATRGSGKRRRTSGQEESLTSMTISIQIILGTYEKILHGLIATIPAQSTKTSSEYSNVEFTDTFLLNAHRSAIRCLAISPPPSSDSTKVILASGSSDQIINLYHISRTSPSESTGVDLPIPTLAGIKITENSRNRELGSLQHHGGAINALYFPTRSKLLSAAEDSTIAVTRTRDWAVLSAIKAPIPKAHGRPSGDTASSGGIPAGVNDFAIHPSMKLMVSIGKGEKCMRLWNLVTGKKAAVLNFDRELLQSVGEGRKASGEGRRVKWNTMGEEFAVAFERGCVVYGINSKPKRRILLQSTKVHQMMYILVSACGMESEEVLALSTEDGRILFYSTSRTVIRETDGLGPTSAVPTSEPVGQLGGAPAGLTGRIKDFAVIHSPDDTKLVVVTGSSDGAVRLWLLDKDQLIRNRDRRSVPVSKINGVGHEFNDDATAQTTERQVGHLLGTYEAGNRITCLAAFLMIKPSQEEVDGLLSDEKEKKLSDIGANENDSASS